MKKAIKLLSALLTIALGVLFVIFKTEVLSICMTVLGVGLLIFAILDLIRFKIFTAVIEGVLGAAVLVIGWTLLDIALFVIALVLGIYGIVELFSRIFEKKKNKGTFVLIVGFIEPLVAIAASAFLLLNGSSALSFGVFLAGVFLIIDGILSLIVVLPGNKGKKKKKKKA